MKPQNKYRSQQKPNIRLLEQALSIKDRLFSMIAVKRGAKRARRWFVFAIVFVILAWIAWEVGGYAVSYAVGQANSLAVENVTTKSLHKMMPRERIMAKLGLEGTVNLATFDAKKMKEKLEQDPAIAAAEVIAELPDTLHIEITERIPIAIVEMEDGAVSGNRTRLFVDPKGHLFNIDEEIHKDFLGVPTWYIRKGDVVDFTPGGSLKAESCAAIGELIVASNNFTTLEIPPIREIRRPKPWKIVLTLETGTEVIMSVEDIPGQVKRLADILENARNRNRRIISTNVIPQINPTVKYDDSGK